MPHTAYEIARSVRLYVAWRSCLGDRHAGCLQLNHRRPPEMCGLRTRLRTDVDPPRFLDPWTDADGLVGGETICNRLTAIGGAVAYRLVAAGATPRCRFMQPPKSGVDLLTRVAQISLCPRSALRASTHGDFEGPGLKSQPRRCRVTVLGKPTTGFTTHVTCRLTSERQSARRRTSAAPPRSRVDKERRR